MAKIIFVNYFNLLLLLFLNNNIFFYFTEYPTFQGCEISQTCKLRIEQKLIFFIPLNFYCFESTKKNTGLPDGPSEEANAKKIWNQCQNNFGLKKAYFLGHPVVQPKCLYPFYRKNCIFKKFSVHEKISHFYIPRAPGSFRWAKGPGP